MRAAATVFAEKGFHGASTRDIAERLGIKQASLYYYFDSKQELFVEAMISEMYDAAEGDDAAVWSHVQALAAMIKDLDPHHPTMTVTAEIGGAKVRAVHTLCPDVDIMGINSYGGLPSVPESSRSGGAGPRYGDGWITLYESPGEQATAAIDTLRQAAADIGRDPAEMGLDAWVSMGAATVFATVSASAPG